MDRHSDNSSLLEILLVEDNPGDVLLMREALRDTKVRHLLRVASDGEEAIDSIRESAPDIVLLDINLPKRDGEEVLAAIRSDPATGHLPVIVLTSSRSPRDIQRMYALHANCYLQKPGSFDEFAEMVRALEVFWLQWAILPIRFETAAAALKS